MRTLSNGKHIEENITQSKYNPSCYPYFTMRNFFGIPTNIDWVLKMASYKNMEGQGARFEECYLWRVSNIFSKWGEPAK